MSLKQKAKKCGMKTVILFMTLLTPQRGIIFKDLKLRKSYMVGSLFCPAFKLWSSKRQYTCHCLVHTHSLSVYLLSEAELRRLINVQKEIFLISIVEPRLTQSLVQTIIYLCRVVTEDKYSKNSVANIQLCVNIRLWLGLYFRDGSVRKAIIRAWLSKRTKCNSCFIGVVFHFLHPKLYILCICLYFIYLCSKPLHSLYHLILR